jgi:hypothetical protein
MLSGPACLPGSHQRDCTRMDGLKAGPPPPVTLPEPPAQSFTWSEYVAMCVIVFMVVVMALSSAIQIASQVITQLCNWLTLVIKGATFMEAGKITSKDSPIMCHSPTVLRDARGQGLIMSAPAKQNVGHALGNGMGTFHCTQECPDDADQLLPRGPQLVHLRDGSLRIQECAA